MFQPFYGRGARPANAELAREWHQSTFQRANDAGRDARGVPIHDRAEGLKPERMGEPAQQFVAAIVMDNRFAHDGTKARHAVAEPFRHSPTMERKIGAS